MQIRKDLQLQQANDAGAGRLTLTQVEQMLKDQEEQIKAHVTGMMKEPTNTEMVSGGDVGADCRTLVEVEQMLKDQEERIKAIANTARPTKAATATAFIATDATVPAMATDVTATAAPQIQALASNSSVARMEHRHGERITPQAVVRPGDSDSDTPNNTAAAPDGTRDEGSESVATSPTVGPVTEADLCESAVVITTRAGGGTF